MQDHDSSVTGNDPNVSLVSEQAAREPYVTKKPLPVVPYVRLLKSGDPSDCPFDRYMMNKKMALLEYSKDKKGGQVLHLQVLLRTCPQCRRLFVDLPQLLGLQKAGLDIAGFDIIGSNLFPRTPGYEIWHPEAIVKTVAVTVPVKVKAPRKVAVKKPRVSRSSKVVVTSAVKDDVEPIVSPT